MFGQFFPVLAALCLGAIAAAAPTIALTLREIEEPWNIVVISEGLGFAELAYIGALAHALILGLPGFLLLRSNGRIGIVSCSCAGFLIGAAPFGALGLLSMLSMQNASVGGNRTVVNHVPTLAGWVEYGSTVGLTGAIGLVGGLTFWAVIQWCGVPAQTTKRDRPGLRTPPWRSWIVCSMAFFLTVTVFVLPHFVRDTSCHNLFRDGRTSARPQISADMNLTRDDWASLRQTLTEFGDTNGLALRGDEEIREGRLMWRTLSLCNEDGVTIIAQDQPWMKELHSPVARRGMELQIFELKSGMDWQTLTRKLFDKLEMQWPERVSYRGPQGSSIPREEAMKGQK